MFGYSHSFWGLSCDTGIHWLLRFPRFKNPTDFVRLRWNLHTQSNIIPYILGFDAGFSSWTREEGKAMAMAEPSSSREHLSSFRRSVRHYNNISTIHTSFNNCRTYQLKSPQLKSCDSNGDIYGQCLFPWIYFLR